ncbi:MAG: hypothetical protein ACRDUX_13035 [Mycobacterium sp.]
MSKPTRIPSGLPGNIDDEVARMLHVAEGFLVGQQFPSSSVPELIATARDADLSPVTIAEAFIDAECHGWSPGFEDLPAMVTADTEWRELFGTDEPT